MCVGGTTICRGRLGCSVPIYRGHLHVISLAIDQRDKHTDRIYKAEPLMPPIPSPRQNPSCCLAPHPLAAPLRHVPPDFCLLSPQTRLEGTPTCIDSRARAF